MRVEGQGTATDFIPAKSEAVVKQVADKEISEKNSIVRLEDLNPVKENSIEEIKIAITDINHAMEISNFHLEFKLYKDSDVYQVKVVNSESNQVIRELPPDYMIELSNHIKDSFHEAVGILVNELV